MTAAPPDDSRPSHAPDGEAEGPDVPPAPTQPEEALPAEPDAEATTSEQDPAEPEVRVVDVVDRRTVRQAPRYGRFVLAGVILGAVVSMLLAFLTPPSQYARGDLFWILFLGLGLLLGVGAAVLALVLDRRSVRRRDARTRDSRQPPVA